MKTKKLFLCIFFLISNSIFADFAKVIIVKGNVTKLRPGDVAATAIKKNEKIPEETSIVTGERSFIKLELPDKSTLNIAANSKIVLQQVKLKDSSMVDLLKGVLQSSVENNRKKNQEKKSKLIIKSPTAVLGVRGTKFQASYNPENNITNIVTVEGEVKMANKSSRIPVNTSSKNVLKSIKKIDQTLNNSKKTVDVKAGRFAGTNLNRDIPTTPVRIAPVQIKALAKKMDAKVNEKTLEKKSFDPDPKGEWKEDGELKAPMAGGILDFETGIYIPPTIDSVYDSKKQIFIASNDIGTVKDNGDYIPPAGLKLDPVKGFIEDKPKGRGMLYALTSKEEEEKKASLKKLNNNLNKNNAQKVKLKKTKTTPEKSKIDIFGNTRLALFLGASYLKGIYTFNSGNKKIDLLNKNPINFLLNWEQKWNFGNFYSLIEVGHRKYELDVRSKEFSDERTLPRDEELSVNSIKFKKEIKNSSKFIQIGFREETINFAQINFHREYCCSGYKHYYAELEEKTEIKFLDISILFNSLIKNKFVFGHELGISRVGEARLQRHNNGHDEELKSKASFAPIVNNFVEYSFNKNFQFKSEIRIQKYNLEFDNQNFDILLSDLYVGLIYSF